MLSLSLLLAGEEVVVTLFLELELALDFVFLSLELSLDDYRGYYGFDCDNDDLSLRAWFAGIVFLVFEFDLGFIFCAEDEEIRLAPEAMATLFFLLSFSGKEL